MNLTFRILVYAIVALAAIFIVVSIYESLFAQEPLSNEMKKALEFANTPENRGKYFSLGSRIIPEGTSISKGSFNTTNMSVALECTSPKKCCPRGEVCEKEINWNYENIYYKKPVRSKISVRCLIYEGTPVCRFYFVEEPAQAQINSVELAEKNTDSALFKIKAKNSGEQTLVNGSLEPKIFKSLKGKWVEIGKDFDSLELESLKAGKNHTFVYNMGFETSGKYKVRFVFSAQNGGFDKNSLVIDIDLGADCEIVSSESETRAIVDSNFYREIHYCTGCSQAYECLDAWKGANPGKDYNILTKDSVYCIKRYEGEECG